MPDTDDTDEIRKAWPERLRQKKPSCASPEEWGKMLAEMEAAQKEREAGYKKIFLAAASDEFQKILAAEEQAKSQGETVSEPTASDKLQETWHRRVEADRERMRREDASEQFTPGQTVWLTKHPHGYQHVTVVATSAVGTCIRYHDDSLGVVMSSELTTTDPNAKPEPQACPFCGNQAELRPSPVSANSWVSCSTNHCHLVGPSRPTSEEAVAAWNSIRVIQTLADPPDWTPGRPFVAKTKETGWEGLVGMVKKVMDADDAPLTEDWLKKVGLRDDDGCAGAKVPGDGDLFLRMASDGSYGLISNGNYFFASGNGDIKTIGDALTLCRLLGVPLKED